MDADNLASALGSMSIAKPLASSSGSVQVLKKGRIVSPETIMEIKTRSNKRKLKMEEVLPQLWFAQTPNLYLGYHTNGKFEEIQKLSVKKDLEQWEKEHQMQLGRLVSLLKKLKAVVQKTKARRCVVVCENKSSGSLKVYDSTKTRGLLRDDILNMYQWDEIVTKDGKIDEAKEVGKIDEVKEVGLRT